ncbi:MAG: valine--tRNA ligase [Gemmatimonadaceae bacterium]|nr:valine--tRNA ligase [Gemmatimonadaceae bacterium]
MPSGKPFEELPAQYNPAETERELYKRWEAAGIFTASEQESDRNGGSDTPFVIVMPPPNVTAVLHMGHGLNNAVQDVITRWRRMSGDETLWVPGTDHAGIATQNVVEKLIARESGQTRFDLGREAFVARTTEFVEETGGAILQQLRAIGASCDWTRTAYTLSPELSLAVREAFVRLHEKKLIYRGHRVIHWCPRCLTSLSDEEAEHSEASGKLYYIDYLLADGGTADRKAITVATTRPETILADVAIAVHPQDERNSRFVGMEVTLPVTGLRVPIIADDYVDPEFGTGALKITPAHDANDFEVGKRHKLAMPVVIDAEGRIQEPVDGAGRVPQSLLGLDRFEAREKIVEMIRTEGRISKIDTHHHGVRHCYRCDTVVEPRLSDQWFVKMQPLAAPALAAVRERKIRIMPERWEAVYINWLEGIRDWNISRQLWWGHRIPVWYCDSCKKEFASREDLTSCPECNATVRQDPDVLDTWFSSWLWPFSTLGWPNEKSVDLKAFYPTDDLITAPEILFFWVARMIMAGIEFMGEPPFHTVYLHGTVRDTNHVKMSKSLGNGIDPLDVVKLYGADALRFTAISGLGMGADVILDPADLEKSFAPGRNFATKLWNIGRFLLSRVGDAPVREISTIKSEELTRADAWILSRLNIAIEECDRALGPARPKKGTWTEDETRSGLRLSEYAESARRLVWNELADWYLESLKGRLQEDGEDREVARAVLVHAFDCALRLLHPIVPFVTEALWQRLPSGKTRDKEFIAASAWPRAMDVPARASEFEHVRNAVVALRQLRADYAIPPGKNIAAHVVSRNSAEVYEQECSIIGRLSSTTISMADGPTSETAAHILLPDGSEILVPLAGVVDIDRECEKLRTELSQLDRQLTALTTRLGNENFTARAPANIVQAEREKHAEWTARKTQMEEKVRSLCGN